MARLNGSKILADENTGNLIDGYTYISTDMLASGALPALMEDEIGGTYRDKLIADQSRVIEQIDGGREISAKNGVITYTFLTTPTTVGIYNNPEYRFPEPEGYTPFSEAQKASARAGMELWDDLIAQDIVEKKGVGADIVFANTTSGPAQAWAYYPGQGYKVYSDIWIHTPESNWSNDWLGFNGYGATTIIHEAGHALGLSHPGAYNFGPDFAVNYANGAEYAQDSEQYSIMSYWSPSETGAVAIDFRTFQFGNGQTPMIHDILTIQAKYGADTTTRAGDTTYGYDSDAGRDAYDMDLNPFPLLAIYDAGGIDTIDMSRTGAGVFIDLRPGSFSSAAADMPSVEVINAARAELFALAGLPAPAPFTQARADANEAFYKNRIENLIEGNTGVSGVEAMAHMNLSIAYNTIIENAVGSSERDYLVGNDVANELSGNGGDDVLNGLGGDDLLTGGEGADTFLFGEGVGGTDTLADFDSGSDKVDLSEVVAAGGLFKIVDGNVFGEVDGVEFAIISQGDAILATDILVA